MSGGERIAIELSANWTDSEKARVTVHGSNLTEGLWKRYLGKTPVTFVRMSRLGENENLLVSYLKRVVQGVLHALRFRMPDSGTNLLYTASDFWPDALPGLVMFLRNKVNCRWVAGFYLFAPNPLKGFEEKGSWHLPSIKNLLYWASQMPIYYLVKRFADAVFVTSEPDVERFVTRKRTPAKVIVVRGGVDVSRSETHNVERDPGQRSYDAVFVGRFHPQKGVVELIDIWKMVCERIPGARLALIGIGPLEEEVGRKISESGLQRQIDLLGFLDGEPKYEVFQNSRLILHPALYDSGGMAAAEGMAFGLPGVAYDLVALRSYYPQGMAKVPVGKPDAFAETVVELLNDEKAQLELGRQARELIHHEWSWTGQADRLWTAIESAGLLGARQAGPR